MPGPTRMEYRPLESVVTPNWRRTARANDHPFHESLPGPDLRFRRARCTGWHGLVIRADNDRPSDHRSSAELEIDAVGRFSLADDHIETRWRSPILVVDVYGIGFARADGHFV